MRLNVWHITFKAIKKRGLNFAGLKFVPFRRHINAPPQTGGLNTALEYDIVFYILKKHPLFWNIQRLYEMKGLLLLNFNFSIRIAKKKEEKKPYILTTLIVF